MQPRNIKTIRDFSPIKFEHSKNQGIKVLMQVKLKYQTKPKLFQNLFQSHNESMSLHLTNHIKKAKSKQPVKVND